MKKILQQSVIIVFLLLISRVVFSEEFTAKITYSEGLIFLRQAGGTVSSSKIIEDYRIGEYELLITGEDGYAELEIMTESYGNVHVLLDNNTYLYFNFSKTAENRQELNFTVLSGSVFFDTGKYNNNSYISVNSRTLYIEAAGASFRTATAPDGSILVTCHSGEITCITSDGNVRKINSGNAIELYKGDLIREVTLGDQMIDLYNNEWFVERVKIYREAAFSVIKPAAMQYEEALEKFDFYYRELSQADKIFYYYTRDEIEYDLGTIESDIQTAAPLIYRMKQLFYDFEDLFHRIEEIKRFYDTMPVRGMLRRRYFISDFMSDFETDYNDNARKMAQVRHYFKLFDRMLDAARPIYLY